MPLRRRAWLTREGWYYMAVLAFIVGGAVLRSINLLVVLAGMMIAPLVLNWRLVMASLSGLTVSRKLPPQVLGGEPLTVEVAVENERWWMSSWLLRVEDWVERVGKGPGFRGQGSGARGQRTGDGGQGESLWRRLLKPLSPAELLGSNKTQAAAAIAHVPARGMAIGTYRITLHRRGRYRFGPLRISTRFPLGLVTGYMTVPAPAELVVAPQLGRLTAAWAELLEAELTGDQRRHPQRGVTEGEYYGLRPWQSGDSLRWVHWRTTARLGRPIVRQYERRRTRDVALVLDPWLPGEFTEREEGLLELAFSLAATAVADVASRGSSRLTCTIAGREPQCWSGPASAIFCEEVLSSLAEFPPTSRPDLAGALERTLEEAPSGARLIVISPRAADAPSLAGASADLPLSPDDLVWVDVGSEQLESLFVLE